MREIKFRGFELDLKRWFYGGYHKHIKRQPYAVNDSLKEEDIQHLIIVDEHADWGLQKSIQIVNVDKSSVGQFTGLYDKNGKEIYEGDIVDIIVYNHIEPEFVDKFIVYYDNNVAGFMFENNKTKLPVCDAKELYEHYYHFEIEVIGNIYENPELMECD